MALGAAGLLVGLVPGSVTAVPVVMAYVACRASLSAL